MLTTANFLRINFPDSNKCTTFALAKTNNGAIAQLVEQRTENPCVPGSIPGGTTPPFICPADGFDLSRVFF